MNRILLTASLLLMAVWSLSACGKSATVAPPASSSIPAATFPPTWTPTSTPRPTPTRTPTAIAQLPAATSVSDRESGSLPSEVPTPSGPTATPPGEDITDPNYIQGKQAYRDKKYDDVLRLMALVIKTNPNLAPPHWYRGSAHLFQKDYQTGLTEMEAALALDPDYALAYADRGTMYFELGNVEQAHADWQKALSLDPTLAKVHTNLAVSYFNAGDYFNALQEDTLALSIDPMRGDTWGNRAEEHLALTLYPACVTDAAQAIALLPDQWESYYVRGTCHANLEQFRGGGRRSRCILGTCARRA